MKRRLTRVQLDRAREALFAAADRVTSQISTAQETDVDAVVKLSEKLLTLLKCYNEICTNATDFTAGALK